MKRLPEIQDYMEREVKLDSEVQFRPWILNGVVDASNQHLLTSE